MVLFDPRRSARETLGTRTILGIVTAKEWEQKKKFWFAGSTIGYPTYTRWARRTFTQILKLSDRIINENNTRALTELNEFYLKVANNCKVIIRTILQEGNAEIIFEESGTAAMSLVYFLAGLKKDEKTVVISEIGRLGHIALQGMNPHSSKDMFKPNVGIYGLPTEIETIKFSNQPTELHQIPEIYSNRQQRPLSEILRDLRHIIENDETVRLVVVPQVTRTGRVLPVKEIGKFIQEINLRRKRRILFVIDAIQAIGREDAEAIRKPLACCDFYVFTGAKALGAILTASAIVAKQETIKELVPNLLNSSFAPYIKFFQFEPVPSEIEKHLERAETHIAIPLPEIASLSEALYKFYKRGWAREFQKRREAQLRKVRAYREKLIVALETMPGLKIVEEDKEIPIVPSIITLTLDRAVFPKLDEPKLKQKLQSGELGVILTPGAMTKQNFFRLEIPEHKKLPKVKKVVRLLRKALLMPNEH